MGQIEGEGQEDRRLGEVQIVFYQIANKERENV